MNEISPPFVGKLGVVKNISKGNEENFDLKLNNCFKENQNNNRMENFTTDLGKNMFAPNAPHFIGRIKPKEKEDKKEEEKDTNDFLKSKGTETEQLNKEKEKEIIPENKNKQKSKNANEIKNSVFIDNYYENKELSLEQKKIISQGYKNDLNLFSSVFAENENIDDEVFEFDLFGSNENKKEKQKEEDFINIQKKNNNVKNKINEKFGGLLKNDDNQDDLLDLMDINTQ